jgi:hypothetical protein
MVGSKRRWIGSDTSYVPVVRLIMTQRESRLIETVLFGRVVTPQKQPNQGPELAKKPGMNLDSRFLEANSAPRLCHAARKPICANEDHPPKRS